MTAITKAVYDKMISSKKARNIDDASYYGYMYSVATKAEKDGEDIVKAFRKEIKSLKDNIQYARSKTELDNINYQISLYDEFMPKELTDEEATKRVDAFFAQQEEMIVQMQKRLEVQKQYRAEFAKILTPQQLAKVFSRSNGEGRMRNGSNGGSQWNGNRPNMPRPGGF